MTKFDPTLGPLRNTPDGLHINDDVGKIDIRKQLESSEGNLLHKYEKKNILR